MQLLAACYKWHCGRSIMSVESQAERQFKPCVNGDFSFLWESHKFDPPQNQNPWSDWDKIWHGWLRRHVNLHKEGFLANRWNIRKNFCSCTYTFFQKLTYRSDSSADFCVQWLKRCGLVQGCAFWELKNLKLIFNVFIQKNSKKITMEPVNS